jgi:hypothetical protein
MMAAARADEETVLAAPVDVAPRACAFWIAAAAAAGSWGVAPPQRRGVR